MGDKILAIDQGTTGSTCLVVEINGGRGSSVLGRGYAEFPQHFPQPGWVEHNLNEIWASVQTAMQQALVAAKVAGSELAAIGITNQRETVGVWSASGEPLAPAIVWQDRRTAERCRALKDAGHEAMVRERTGLVLDPYFSGTKLAWLLHENPTLRQRAQGNDLRFGTIDTWLMWQLSGGLTHATDPTNACRTLLFDLHKLDWDPELCAMIGEIPTSILPQVLPSSGVFATTKGVAGLPDGIPVAGVAGDQQAALFGQGCFETGMAKCTYGTGAFALVNTGSQPIPSKNGLLTTVAWQLGKQAKATYALEGSTFVAGAAVQWLRDGLGIIERSSDIEALAAQVPDSGGVVFVPALTGLGAPHWRPDARGVVCGLTRGSTRAHLARAALEGIALQVSDLLAAMREDSGAPLELLRADGGASANNLLMQFQADVLGVQLHRPKILDTTAMGAAYLAALGVGIFTDTDAIAKAWALDRTYEPQMDASTVQEHKARWGAAVAKA